MIARHVSEEVIHVPFSSAKVSFTGPEVVLHKLRTIRKTNGDLSCVGNNRIGLAVTVYIGKVNVLMPGCISAKIWLLHPGFLLPEASAVREAHSHAILVDGDCSRSALTADIGKLNSHGRRRAVWTIIASLGHHACAGAKYQHGAAGVVSTGCSDQDRNG